MEFSEENSKDFKDFEEKQKKDLVKFEEENKSLIQQEAVSKAIVDICHKHKYEMMKCINCPIIKECAFTAVKIDKIKERGRDEANDVYENEIAIDDSPQNVLKAQNRRDIFFDNYVKQNAKSALQDTRCVFERKDIMSTLQRFVNAGYNLADPRCYMIVNELISNILNSGRINKSFTEQGLLLTKMSAKGAMYQVSNPLLKNKIDFSRFIIEATEALDRILKSDEDQRAEKDFTAHLLKELKLRDKMKAVVNDSFDRPIIDVTTDGHK